MIGEELTAIICRLQLLQGRLRDTERLEELGPVILSLEHRIEDLRDLRGRAFGKVLVDPAKMAVELERREAGVR